MASVIIHVGLTVTDMARSRRFYEGAFGFRYDRELKMPAKDIDALLALDPPSDIHAVYLTLGGFTLELMAFDPPAQASAAGQTFNQTGLAHLSIAVDDKTATLARIAALGGAVLTAVGRAAVVRDPDGALIELVDRAVHDEVERGRAERGVSRF